MHFRDTILRGNQNHFLYFRNLNTLFNVLKYVFQIIIKKNITDIVTVKLFYVFIIYQKNVFTNETRSYYEKSIIIIASTKLWSSKQSKASNIFLKIYFSFSVQSSKIIRSARVKCSPWGGNSMCRNGILY